jgi:hypothetical protein
MAAYTATVKIEGKKVEAVLSSDGVLRWPGRTLDILNEVSCHALMFACICQLPSVKKFSSVVDGN